MAFGIRWVVRVEALLAMQKRPTLTAGRFVIERLNLRCGPGTTSLPGPAFPPGLHQVAHNDQ